MKKQQLELLRKVANGELTPEKAQVKLLGLFVVSASFLSYDKKPATYVEREMLRAIKNIDHTKKYIKNTKRIGKTELIRWIDLVKEPMMRAFGVVFPEELY